MRTGPGALPDPESPLGTARSRRGSGITAVLLPRASRDRWREEWVGKLSTLPGRRSRVRFVLRGLPRLTIVLRRPAARGKPVR